MDPAPRVCYAALAVCSGSLATDLGTDAETGLAAGMVTTSGTAVLCGCAFRFEEGMPPAACTSKRLRPMSRKRASFRWTSSALARRRARCRIQAFLSQANALMSAFGRAELVFFVA